MSQSVIWRLKARRFKKGTWLMTMEVSDDEVWDKIEKGEITGFSMGGKGSYSEVDVDISDPDNPVAKAGGKKGILKALASYSVWMSWKKEP